MCTCEKFLSLSIARRYCTVCDRAAPPLTEPFTTSYHPIFVFSPRTTPLHLSLFSFLMSQPSSQSSTSSFQDLFNAALNDYENQTGTKLVEHPLARKIEACDSVDSIIAIFQEQAQIFRKFKDDGKMMKSIKSSVGVLYTLSNSTLLGEGVSLVRLKSVIAAPCS